jgi:hypothetical protein
MIYSAAASRYVRPARFLSVVTPRHMEDTTEYSVPMLRSRRVDSSGQPCFEMLRNLCGDAQDIRNMGISTPVMLCH